MLGSKSARRVLLPCVASAAFAVGCGMSTSHVAMPMSSIDAPKIWQPIMTCATERGLKYVDASKESDPHVRVSIDPNTQLDILYEIDGNHVEMELIIWGETTDADREKILARLRQQGDDIWACAQQKLSGATTAAAASASATPAPTPHP